MMFGIHTSGIPVPAFVMLFSAWVPLSLSKQVSQQYVGQQDISNACYPYASRKRKIEVTDIYLLCDSQDENEEGYQYSNSMTCRPGDLAKTSIQFTVSKMSDDLDIYVDVNSYGFGRKEKIWNETSICDFSYLFYQGDDYQKPYGYDDDLFRWADDFYGNDGSNACPLKDGPYTLVTSFEVPEYNGVDVDFTPALRIRFNSYDSDQMKSLAGCVETGSWARLSHNRQKQKRGQRLFSAAFFIFVVSFGLCLYCHRRKRKEGERAQVKRAASMMRRFHYIRSTRSGDVSLSQSSMSGSFAYGEGLRSPSSGMIEVT